jgi:hypothetical protein
MPTCIYLYRTTDVRSVVPPTKLKITVGERARKPCAKPCAPKDTAHAAHAPPLKGGGDAVRAKDV